MPAFAFPDGVMFREVDGEMVLLNLKTEQYFGLDRVGADIVTRLTTGPFDKTFTELCRDYEVDAAVLRLDIDRLLEDLVAEGLLERVQSRR